MHSCRVCQDNIVHAFAGSCVYPTSSVTAMDKLSRGKKANDDQKIITKYSEILSVPSSPLPPLRQRD